MTLDMDAENKSPREYSAAMLVCIEMFELLLICVTVMEL